MVRKLKFRGQFVVDLFDKNGKLKAVRTAKNGITNVGKDKLLDVVFNAAVQINPWFMGLIDAASFTALAAGDTMASHGGWLEINTQYNETTRPIWLNDSPASQQITNTIKTVFTFNATKTVKGFFLNSLSGKGGVTGTLWCTALFDQGDLAVVAADVIKVVYTLST